MQTAKVKVPPQIDDSLIVPVVIPDLEEVRAFARLLHSSGRPWQGEFWGWSAEYTPESRRKPVDSKMTFTPADFWIGVSGVWFFSLMWEHGKERAPVEFLDERGIMSAY